MNSFKSIGITESGYKTVEWIVFGDVAKKLKVNISIFNHFRILKLAMWSLVLNLKSQIINSMKLIVIVQISFLNYFLLEKVNTLAYVKIRNETNSSILYTQQLVPSIWSKEQNFLSRLCILEGSILGQVIYVKVKLKILKKLTG